VIWGLIEPSLRSGYFELQIETLAIIPRHPQKPCDY